MNFAKRHYKKIMFLIIVCIILVTVRSMVKPDVKEEIPQPVVIDEEPVVVDTINGKECSDVPKYGSHARGRYDSAGTCVFERCNYGYHKKGDRCVENPEKKYNKGSYWTKKPDMNYTCTGDYIVGCKNGVDWKDDSQCPNGTDLYCFKPDDSQ